MERGSPIGRLRLPSVPSTLWILVLLLFSTAGTLPARLGVSVLVMRLAAGINATWFPKPVMTEIHACNSTIGRLNGPSSGELRDSVQTTSGVPKPGTTRIIAKAETISSRTIIAMVVLDRTTCRSSRQHRPPTWFVEETRCCNTSSTRETFGKKYSELRRGIIRRYHSGRRRGYDQRVAVLPVKTAAAVSAVIQQCR